MSYHRHYLINERVKALVLLLIIMSGTILLVFLGIEILREMPSLLPEQRIYLDNMRFPAYFKLLVVIVWGLIAMLCAYLYLLYQYVGFIARFSRFCDEVIRKDNGQMLVCRRKENTNVMKDSFNTLLKLYRQESSRVEQELKNMREKLLIRMFK